MPWKPDYVDNTAVREFVRVDDGDDDAVIARAITGSSRAVDRFCGRQFGKVAAPEARYYTARWSRTKSAWTLTVDDYQSVAGLLISWDSAFDGTYATVVDPTKIMTWPPNAAVEGKPWESILLRSGAGSFDGRPLGFKVTLPWGWSSVPTPVAEATLLQISRLHARRDAPFGVVGSPTEGSEIRLLAKLDPDVVTTLQAFRRRTWVR